MVLLTVADVLQLPIVREAQPRVLAGDQHLQRGVRWVHSSELSDVGTLLRGGELVLSTGIALSDDAHSLERFAADLGEAPAAGLMIEMGRRWTTALPQALIRACERHNLPLITVTHEVRFAAVAQAVGEMIVDAQLA